MQRPFRMQATPQDPRQQHSNPTVRTHFNPRLTVRIPRIVSIPQRAIPRKPCDLQTQYRSQAESLSAMKSKPQSPVETESSLSAPPSRASHKSSVPNKDWILRSRLDVTRM